MLWITCGFFYVVFYGLRGWGFKPLARQILGCHAKPKWTGGCLFVPVCYLRFLFGCAITLGFYLG